jgi:pyrroloquinoline quinone biosynthesis protein D
MISEQTAAALAPGVKLRFDKAREAWVLLAPERMFALDEAGVEIVKLTDGMRTAGEIADDLATRFQAPREVILADVIVFFQDLADNGAVRT